MDQALRNQALSQFQDALRKMNACLEHPTDSPIVVLDEDGMVAAFDDFLGYIIGNFSPPSSGDLESQTSLWGETSVDDWAAGNVQIEREWVPAFLVRRLMRSVPNNKFPPPNKAKSWLDFVAMCGPRLANQERQFSLPLQGNHVSSFEWGDVIVCPKPWGITQRSITAVFVEASQTHAISQYNLEDLDGTALPAGWHLLCQNQLIQADKFHEMVISCFSRARKIW